MDGLQHIHVSLIIEQPIINSRTQAHTDNCLIDPQRYAFQNFAAYFLARDGRGKEFPICLGVQVPVVEGKPIFLPDAVVPVALHLVNVLGDKAAYFGLGRRMDWFLMIIQDKWADGGRVVIVKVEAEKSVAVDIVYRSPRAIPIVGKFCVCLVARDTVLFPFPNIFSSNFLHRRVSHQHLERSTKPDLHRSVRRPQSRRSRRQFHS